jgi:hypothetical protein
MKIDAKAKNNMDKRWNSMRTEMLTWVPGWRDIQRFILPTRGFFDDRTPNYGREIDHKTLLDGRPGRAIRVSAAGMLAGMASPSRPWFRLGVENDELMAMDEVKIWLEEVQNKLMLIFSKSNIYEMLHSSFEEILGFGTCAAILLEDFDTVVRARNFTAGEYALGQDSRGHVNSLARYYSMTVGQLVEEFGIENVPPSVKNNYQNNQIDGFIRVCHLIEPNDDRVPGLVDSKNMPFRSVYWVRGSEPTSVLRVDGYEEFPVVAARWHKTTTAYIYGYGPGHDALGDVKQLMKQNRDKLVGMDKVIDPPVVEDGTIQGQANTLPGGVTRSSSQVQNSGVRPAYQINLPLQELRADINELAMAIDDTFYKPLFLMLSQTDNTQKTAFEIAKRYEEKLFLLGPFIERQEEELLDPIVTRTFNIALRTGVIPPPPPSLQGMDLKIEYISILAQAQKLAFTAAIERVMAFAGTIGAADPSVYDNIDFDQAIKDYAEMTGIPQKILRSDAVVAKLRQQKQAQQEALARQQQAAAMVDGAKTLSETKIGPGNALEAMTGTEPATQLAGAK